MIPIAAPLADGPFPFPPTLQLVDVTNSSDEDIAARRTTGPSPLARVRELCRRFPDVTERLSHGAPAWFVRGRRSFATCWPYGHHQHHFPHLWLAAPPGAQRALVTADPARYFRPPYVGVRGWIGVRLDGDPDWGEIAVLVEEAYRTVVPSAYVGRPRTPRRR